MTTAEAKIAAVIFDWGGTLTPWHTVDPIEAWLAVAGGDSDIAAKLHKAELEIWKRHLDRQQSATITEIFAAAQIEHTAEMLRAFHDWWDPHTYTDPDAPPLFTALHDRGIKVGVLSNTVWPRAEHERIFARDGVLDLIDGAVYTSDIPWTKPHPQAFRAALDAVEVDEPGRAVFVGDRLYDDISGANAVGMRSILVPHSDIPPDQFGPVTGQPDAVVGRLAEILDVVEMWR